jgi:hypothetical protein
MLHCELGFRLRNPENPWLIDPTSPEFRDFFPESLGFTLKTLIHKCCASLLLIISHFHILLPIQKMRVKIRRETEEPSTQRRTKARHDVTTRPGKYRTIA